MYNIKFYDYDLHLQYDKDLYLINPVLSLGDNQSATMTARILASHPYFAKIDPLKFGMKIYREEGLIFRGRVDEFEQDFENIYRIHVEDKLSVLNDSICRPKSFSGSPEELFTWIIENHNSQVSEEQRIKKGVCDVTDNNNYIAREWKEAASSWDILNSRLIKTLGGHLIVRYESDGDYLDWITEIKDSSSQKIEFGENMIDFHRLVKASDTYTACIPYGAVPEGSKERIDISSVNSGNDYLINDKMAKKYGIIFAPPNEYTWDDVTIPDNLKKKALAKLNNVGVMLNESMDLEAVDLAMAGVDINSFELHQKVSASSPQHSLEGIYEVSKMRIALDAAEVLKISVGKSRDVLSSQILDNRTKTNLAIGEMNKNIKSVNEELSTVVQEIRNISSTIAQTAEEITLGIVGNYATITALEEQRKHLENMLKINEDGFNFEFSQLKEKLTAVGNELAIQKEWIRLINGEIQIGKSDSPITSVYTNDALEFRYNGAVVAKFTNEFLEVRNIAVKNQLKFGDKWAIRPGQYIKGKGYNLNDVWLGGR